MKMLCLSLAELKPEQIDKYYDREILEFEDGGKVAIDFYPKQKKFEEDAKKMAKKLKKKEKKLAKAHSKFLKKNNRVGHENSGSQRSRDLLAAGDEYLKMPEKEFDKFEVDAEVEFSSLQSKPYEMTLNPNGIEEGPHRSGFNSILSDGGKIVPKDPTPIVIIIPGTGGTSCDVYLLNAARYLYKEHGFRSVIANRRGYAGVPITGKAPLSWVRYQDTDDLVEYLQKVKRYEYIFIMGFSLGGCFTVNYLADRALRGEFDGIYGGISVSPPWCLMNTELKVSKKGYVEKYFVTAMQARIKSHIDNPVFRKYLEEVGIDEEEVFKPRSISKFDEAFSLKLYQKDTLQNYYDKFSAKNNVKHVKTKLLTVSSRQDPIIE